MNADATTATPTINEVTPSRIASDPALIELELCRRSSLNSSSLSGTGGLNAFADYACCELVCNRPKG